MGADLLLRTRWDAPQARAHKNHRRVTSPLLALAILLYGSLCTQADTALWDEGTWKLSLPGWEYKFPRDHGNHPDFKTEWWYFTGNLVAKDGHEYGYQLTFFRQGIIPPGESEKTESSLVARQIAFAHFAVSNISGNEFLFDEKITRGAFGEAGWNKGNRLAWIEDWFCDLTGEHSFHISAETQDFALDLRLQSLKPPVFHGSDGVSQKAAGKGRASHYYSLTRLYSAGTVRTPRGVSEVTGLSWFDHEWATNQLTQEQEGWDWFSLQFEDGTELMIFQIRTKDGGRDPFSGGTWVAADGQTTKITNEDFYLKPVRTWKSGQTQASYPVAWELRIPSLKLELQIEAAKAAQELNLSPIVYWEGAVRATGHLDGTSAKAKGYLEMTGYGSPIVGMQAPSAE